VLVDRHRPPYRTAGVILLALLTGLGAFIYFAFRGDLSDKAHLTLVSPRAGLVVEPGSKVTFNGVEIGRVSRIAMADQQGTATARLTLDVNPRYLSAMPANVTADIRASTVFGNKYVSFSSPKDPSPQRISDHAVIDASAVTTEFNTLFETVNAIAEKVDPIKVNQTLAATAEALTGLGDRFGASLENGNRILEDMNSRMPRFIEDNRGLADLADVYADASPDLWDGLEHAVRTAQTFNEHRADLDEVLMAATGFADDAADSFERAGPYLVRGAADLVPTTALLDDYRGMILCTIRKFGKVQPRAAAVLGGNGYSLNSESGTFASLGGPNPYIYPDNLPRTNAHGGPEGRPGCWQDISRDLWPAPYLVMDTGASIAPYNHIALGQPMFIDYVWGRQVGEYSINP
jgi:phospholipid/cholesterol/gamma-HCH transport system substrate-binding protein